MPAPVTSAHRLMYPAASLFAALAVPLWLAQIGGLLPLGWSPAIHAHEMTLGYALAVVGGFLMTPGSARMTASTFNRAASSTAFCQGPRLPACG